MYRRRYVGLGVDPATAAAGYSIGKKIIGWLTKENPDIPSGWVDRAYSGATAACQAGVATRSAAEASAGIRELFPDWQRGRRVYYDKSRIASALALTPEGMPGDPSGTRQALVGAMQAMAPGMRPPRSLSELVNMAQYYAHGRGDCDVGYAEEPAVEHLERIMRRYAGADSSGSAPRVDLALDYQSEPSPVLAIAAMLGLVLVLRG